MIKQRRIRWAEHVALWGEEEKIACGMLEGKPKGKGPIGRARLMWEDIIKMDGVVWTGLIWLRIGISGGPLTR
jgi:hypothetical protein